MITIKALKEAVTAHILANPNVKYEEPTNVSDASLGGCSYTQGQCSDGSNGCIFGQVLYSLGIAIPEGHDNSSIGILLALLLKREELEESSRLDSRWCGTLQQAQDRGHTWIQALAKADSDTKSI